MYENVSIWVESNYVNGFEHGKSTVYNKNGRSKTVSHYKHGLLKGDYVEYYKDGTTRLQTTYEDNVPTGLHYTFYPNGALKTVTLYSNEGQSTLFLSYHSTGESMKMFRYDEFRYDESTGALINKIEFTGEGELFLWTIFHPKGKGKPLMHLKATAVKVGLTGLLVDDSSVI